MEESGQGLNQTALAYAALDAVAAAIDECHTVFFDPEQYTQYTTRLEGNETYAGIGVYLQRTRPVVVGEVFPGTPAEQAGLHAGDTILAVEGQDVTGLGADQLGPLVRGREGTRVTLTVQRPGEPAPRDVTITRAQISVPVFNSRVVDGPNGQKVGYLRLYSFSPGAEEEIDRALRDFVRQGVRGWVLDLRDNGGGYIDTLAAVAGRFAPGVTIGYRIYRGGQENPQPTDPDAGFDPQLPLAVLVDAGSASASEWFAAAMQDLGRGRVFGETTAGCLAGATTYPLADGSALSITIEKIVSPQRREINRVGVQPDEEVAPAATGDPALTRALAWLVAQPR
jgi:carboxyl-terminal processing protease